MTGPTGIDLIEAIKITTDQMMKDRGSKKPLRYARFSLSGTDSNIDVEVSTDPLNVISGQLTEFETPAEQQGTQGLQRT